MNRMEMKIMMISNGKKKFLLAAALVGLSAATLAPTNVVNADEIYYENQYGANQNYLRYEAVDGQLKDAEIVNNRTFDTLAYEASDNSYVKVDNKGSVTFTAKEGADGLTMRYSIKDGDKGEVKVYVNGEPMRTFHFLPINMWMAAMSMIQRRRIIVMRALVLTKCMDSSGFM